MEIIPNRVFSSLYIILDCIFLTVLLIHFIRTKRYIPLIVGLLGGVLYFLVDFGGFYLILGTREVVGANTALFLFWLSMSYGFTNMTWMWLWFDEKENRLEWSALIATAWFSIAIITAGLGDNWPQITMKRGTLSYHWIMALFLVIGYTILILKNLSTKSKVGKYKEVQTIDIKSIFFIGILIQFTWETILYLTGIRRAGIQTLIINSLLETNLGAPYMYLIYLAVRKKWPRK